MRWGNCEECGKFDCTGWMPCVRRWLCPLCASKRLLTNETATRVEITSSVFILTGNDGKKGGKRLSL